MSWTRFLDDQVLSWLLRVRGELEAPVKVVYVDVDSNATGAFGSQPWNRAIFAYLAEGLLAEGRAKAVGFDFVFSEYGHEAARAGNAELRGVSNRYPGQLVMGATYVTELGPVREDLSFPFRFLGFRDPEANDLPELPEIGAAGFRARVGLIDVLERAGTPYLAPMFAEARGARYLHFALQLALVEWGLDQSAVRIDPSYSMLEVVDPADVVVARIPLIREQFIRINWHSPWMSDKNPRWSAAAVAYHLGRLVEGTPEERERAAVFLEVFEDAIVLIGPVDPGLRDRSTTPFDPRETVPKVGVHGNLIKTIITGHIHQRLPERWEILLGCFLAALVIPALAVDGRAGVVFRLGAGGLLLFYFTGSVWLFSTRHWILPMAVPFLAAVSTASVGAVIRGKAAEIQRRRIEGLFGSYLAPAMVQKLIAADDEPQLGGEEVEITAFFSDAERFSTFSEKLAPPEIVSLMNEYLTAMTDILMEEKATLDKYIGDAIVAFFGSPVLLDNHAWLACHAAVRMQRQQLVLCRKWLSEKDRWPVQVTRMRTRIGLSSGLAVTGNMGSNRHFNYTMMGDVVNVGARLEQLGKEFGSYILATGETKRQAERCGADFVFRSLGSILVSGRAQEVEVYELLGMRDEVSKEVMESVRLFEAGLALYQSGRLAEAEPFFSQAKRLELADGRTKSPASVFHERCCLEAEGTANVPPV